MTDAWSAIGAAATALQTAAVRAGSDVTRDRIFGIDSAVCRFRPFGTLTRVHLTMVIGAFPPGWGRRDLMEGFIDEAVDTSIRTKGGLPAGFQSGTATVAVAVTDQLVEGAHDWATKQHSRFAAIGYPVTVELATGRITRPDRMIIGRVYARSLKEFVQTQVNGVLYPRQPSRS